VGEGYDKNLLEAPAGPSETAVAPRLPGLDAERRVPAVEAGETRDL
jgi:hypothetical protein